MCLPPDETKKPRMDIVEDKGATEQFADPGGSRRLTPSSPPRHPTSDVTLTVPSLEQEKLASSASSSDKVEDRSCG
jgi:hypothetical protein